MNAGLWCYAGLGKFELSIELRIRANLLVQVVRESLQGPQPQFPHASAESTPPDLCQSYEVGVVPKSDGAHIGPHGVQVRYLPPPPLVLTCDRYPESSAMVIDVPAINAKQNGMAVDIIAPQDVDPLVTALAQLMKQAAAHIRYLSTTRIRPRLWLPVPPNFPPKTDRRDAEGWVRLAIAVVLRASDRGERAGPEASQPLIKISDRERVAIQEHDQVLVVAVPQDYIRQGVQFLGMTSPIAGYVREPFLESPVVDPF
jgi:hypothetical protein